MNKRRLQTEQLESKIKVYAPLANVIVPPTGWVKAIRSTLGMSLQQLANRLSITKQSVSAIEKREKEGSISLKTLRETANALDMHLVYGLVPKDGSLDALISRKATELAEKIVLRASATMKLEDQENSKKRIRKAVEQRAALLKYEMPKILWD